MGGNDANAPHAYSTQLRGDYQSGYRADGYNVVIDPDTLKASIDKHRAELTGAGTQDMNTTIVNVLIESGAFGDLPNAGSAYNEVFAFVQSHTEAMHRMGVSLEDFVARVQAAAELGYESDPVTKQQAAYARAHQRMME
jgi:hypothetical protein